MKTRTFYATLLGAWLVLLSAPAAATTATLPSVVLVDAWDRADPLESRRGKPTLIVYEDKESVQQNAGLKAELATLARNGEYKKRVALVAVADVSGYDYWPARGFVRSAIREETHKQGTLIFCDWNGGVRNALGFTKGRSNVALFGRDGRILFSGSGALDDQQRKTLIDLLRREVES